MNISRDARFRGCSDAEANYLLNYLLSTKIDEWEHSDIYATLYDLLLDKFKFVPIINGKQNWKKSVVTILPNAIYKKLLIYIILHIRELKRDELMRLRNIITLLEGHAITGFIYVSSHGRAFDPVKQVLDTTKTRYDIVPYSDYLNQNKLDNGIAIHNTLIVFLINNLINK